jgi:hypothetical protein
MIALFKTLIVALALLIAVNAQCSGDTPVNGTPAFACSNNAWYTSGNAMISGGSQTWESFVFISGNMVMDNGAVVIANRNVSVSGRVDIMNNAAFHVGVNGHLQVGAALMLSSGGQLHFYASNTYSYNVTQCIDAAGGVFHVWGVTNGMAIFFPTNCIITYPGSIVAHTVDPCVAATITYTATGVNTVYSSTGAQGCPANVNPPANPPANQPANPPANTPGTTNAPAKQSNPPGSVPNPDNGGVSPKEVSTGLVALSFLLLAARNL